MSYLFSFLFAGVYCLISQIVFDRTKLTPGHIVTISVILGCFLSFIGVCQFFLDYAPGGAGVLILNYGNLLYSSGLEGLKEKLARKIYNKRLITPLIPIVYTLDQLYSMELLPFCNVLCEKMYPTVEDIDNSVNKRFSKVNSESYSNLYQKLIEESHIAQYRVKCRN